MQRSVPVMFVFSFLICVQLGVGDCLFPDNSSDLAWEATIQSCEEVEPILLQTIRKWEEMSEVSAKKLAAESSKHQKGILIKLKPIRSREYTIGHSENGKPKVKWTTNWNTVDQKVKAARFFWTGSHANCGKVKKGEIQKVIIERHCCDTIPPRSVACILQISTVYTINQKIIDDWDSRFPSLRDVNSP